MEETPVIEESVAKPEPLVLGQEGEEVVGAEGETEVIVYDYDADGVVIGTHKEVVA